MKKTKKLRYFCFYLSLGLILLGCMRFDEPPLVSLEDRSYAISAISGIILLHLTVSCYKWKWYYKRARRRRV